MKRPDDARMSAGKDLSVGASVACVSKFAIVNVELPTSALRPMFDVDEFAVLSVTREPAAPGCAPSRSLAPPRRGGCVVQREDAINTVIKEKLRAIDDRRDVGLSIDGIVNSMHAAGLISSTFRSTGLSIFFNCLAGMSLGRREIL